ncbi:MAG: glycosyltransferase family 2 protein, partial [Actinobacteria bacterium]|nr:glycosyltransferase family 2 protein [Actinomycetota bacterium]
NTRDLLQRCLQSVLSFEVGGAGMEVLVVDNASTDGSADMVTSRFPQVRLIASSENLGFATANNLAIQEARGKYLMLLNPDAEPVGAVLPLMVEFAEEHPQVAVVGPQLLNPDGTIQSSRRRFPTRATAFLESTVLQRWMPNHPALRRYYLLDRTDEETQEVDWLVGACLMVRASAVEAVGTLDEGFFMYSEEMDWCRRFALAGWKTVYLSTAKVIHHGGGSSEQDLFHRHTRFQHAKARYFQKHDGALFAELLRLLLLANYLFLLLEDTIKLLLPWKRSMRLRRIGVLVRVLAWMLLWVATSGRTRP